MMPFRGQHYSEEIRENWQVALVGFCVLFFGFSAPAYALPFLYPEVIAEFGWSRSEATSLSSVKYLTGALACVVVGRLVDIIGVWISLLSCVILGALALLSFLLVDNLTSYLAVGVLLGIAGPGAMVSVFVLIARTFQESQGTATGLVLLGTGLGGFAMPLIIAWAIDTFGWRTGMAVLSLGIWIVAVPLLIYGLKTLRVSKGKSAPPALETAKGIKAGALKHLTQLSKMRSFWLMAAAFFAVTIADQAFTQHQVLMFRDAAVSDKWTALAISAIGLFSMFGRIIAGAILDGWSNRGLAFLYVLLTMSAVLAMFLVHPAILGLFVVVRALGHASVMIDGPVIARHTFGTAHLGVLLGLFTAMANLGSATGPVLMAAMFDATGSYSSALWLFVALPLLSALMIYFVRPDVWLRQRDEALKAAALAS